MKKKSHESIAQALYQVLSGSSLDWQYCFLERGGDGSEVYLSSEELLQRSLSLSENILATIPKEKPVVLMMEHGPDLIIALLACFFAGRVVVLAPLPRLGTASLRLNNIFEAIDDAVILTREEYLGAIEQIVSIDLCSLSNKIVCVDALKNLAFTHKPKELPGFSIAPDSTIIIQFTSGSTSAPKGVLVSSENVMANQLEMASRWGCTQGKTFLTWLPMYHDMGLFGILEMMLSGMKVVQMDPLHFTQKPQRWLKAMSRFKAHYSGGPPFAFDLCNDLEPDRLPHNLDLSHWEVAFCGADYVPSETLQRFRSKFKSSKLSPNSVIPVYGLAEATVYVAGQPSSSGHTLAVHQSNYTEGCYLGDEDKPSIVILKPSSKQKLEDGEVGEICLYGESVFGGYYNEPSSNHGGFLRTGDLGVIEGNWLFIIGRIKDVIISHGQTISPSTIEQVAALAHEQLNPSAAAAFQTVNNTDAVFLLIEIKSSVKRRGINQVELCSKIRQLVTQRTGVALAKVQILKRGQLMRTTSGKIKRKAVATQFENHHIFKEVENVDNY
ncbi:AMP-binding protein [Shewanella waksmanii]|uniref:AMP-binding protein n=1 Tax=Shewanella waksmanii TaxID=213783 RepID=UPI003734EC69